MTVLSHSPKEKPLAKTMVVFSLEDVLIPGTCEPELDSRMVKKWLSSLQAYAQKHPPLHAYIVSGFTQSVCNKKMNEFGLNPFFSPERVFGVNEAYLSKMEPVDLERYSQRCENDPYCKDEYFRQVQMMELMKREGQDASKLVLVGRDYWFDGFYTRRFSNVDVAFIESALSSRGKPMDERMEGLWYIDRTWGKLKKIIEGKVPTPNYAPLDAYVNITMTQELLGGKGIPSLKRVVIQRKKEDSGFDFTSLSK
jgi:hypothetical protein